MAVLWTDLITPDTLTGYVRQSLADYELSRGTLARWLPNRVVADMVVRFIAGQSGLVEEARFRAYDAEPEMGRAAGGQRVTLELPAVSQEIPVSEYAQQRMRNASDDAILNQVLATADRVVRAIGDAVERLRGTVLVTGNATITQNNFKSDDTFGRAPGHTVTAGTLWTLPATDRLAYLQTIYDLYLTTNGVAPGSIVTSTRVLRALQAGTQFATQLGNGASRAATVSDMNALIEGSGLPPIYVYDRRTLAGRVTPDDRLLLLPAPVDPGDDMGTELGATFWGQTLTASDSAYQLADVDAPGLVAGVYRNSKPPLIAEVIGDAISLPVLANANLSLAAKVL